MKKTLLVKQRDRSDCGPACLASVARYYGLRLPISRIRLYAGTNRHGTSLQGLSEAAEKLLFKTKAARLKEAAVTDIPFPAIFHLNLENGLQHFVVVYKIKREKIILMDPALGKFISQPTETFKNSWTGVVLLLKPSDKFRKGNEQTPVILRFWQLVQPHRPTLLLALLWALVYTVLGLSTSFYIQKIIDFVLPDANMRLINMLSTGMIIIQCFRIFIGYFRSIMMLRTGQQIDTRLIMGYYKHLMDLPQRFFDTMRVGEIISRVNDALRIRVFICDVALNLAVHILTILLSLSVMFFYNWKLGLFMSLTIPFYMLIYRINNRINAGSHRKMMESSAALESQLLESIQGITTIRRFAVSAHFELKTENRFMSLMRAIYMGNNRSLILISLSDWMTQIWTIFILWFGAYLVIDQVLSPGELLSIYTLAVFFTAPVQAVITANKPMQDALIAADRLFEIVDMETVKGGDGGLTFEQCKNADLVFNDVHFRYGSGAEVFTGLNIRIPQNRITAVIGESGCGKSTLLALIQKLYIPDQGNILIGDTNIQQVSDDLIRRRVVAVPQQADLFHGTIIFNISLGDEKPDMERIIDICKQLGLHDFITRLPCGYNTIIRDQGSNLSGGQLQKLGLARALYRDPAILILDEATSAMDPESECQVQAALRWYHEKGTTIVVIAHRLSTIRCCDYIIFLRPGEPAACGTHEKLIYENAVYAKCWNLQGV
jgi:ATP-binding cassette, subfamily C, bacteriocin exporter